MDLAMMSSDRKIVSCKRLWFELERADLERGGAQGIQTPTLPNLFAVSWMDSFKDSNDF